MKFLIKIFIFSIIYFFIKNYIPYWYYIVYPITLFVTFLHEFWHSFFALITWWGVESLKINPDGSWLATTYNGIRSFVIMWWYIWSAIFWWLLIYFWSLSKNYSKYLLYIILWLLIFSSIFWFASVYSTIIQLLLALWIFVCIKFLPNIMRDITLFLGINSLVYIIMDFNVWPSSDLSNFSWLIPAFIWMYIWLVIVLVIWFISIKLAIKNENKRTY